MPIRSVAIPLVSYLTLPFGSAMAVQERHAFVPVHVFDGTGTGLQRDRAVVVEGARILEVVPAADFEADEGTTVVPGESRFMIPGLWDMHVHFQELEEQQMALFPAFGVTSIREMGDPPELVHERRDAIEAGDLVGPRILAAMYMIDNPMVMKMLSQMASEEDMELEWQRRLSVETPEEAREAAHLIADAGADFIKLHWNQSRETYLALAEEARKVGLRFAGHDPLGQVTVEDWISAGQHSIDHIDGTFGAQLDQKTPEQREVVLRGFAEAGVHFVPTLVLPQVMSSLNDRGDPESKIEKSLEDPQSIYVSDALLRFWIMFFRTVPARLPALENFGREIGYLREFHHIGIRIMPGTDLGIPRIYPGYSLHDELALFVDHLGMTPGEAIESATRVPAEFFELDKDLGTIEVGKIADLVILDANPLEDIRHTRSIRGVVLGGKWYDLADLEELRSEARVRPKSSVTSAQIEGIER